MGTGGHGALAQAKRLQAGSESAAGLRRLEAEEDQIASYDGRTPLQQRALKLLEPHLVRARYARYVHGALVGRAWR